MSKNSKQSKSKSGEPDYVLAYSTDPKPCVHCGKSPDRCTCTAATIAKNLNPVVSFERSGRAGKSVTVVSRLPADEKFLKDLCAFLKRSSGSGGTFYIREKDGVIEIQGERCAQVKDLIQAYKR